MKSNSILIIGGTSDIGLALAIEFAKLSYEITLTGRNLLELEIAKEKILTEYNTKVSIIKINILDYDSLTNFVDSMQIFPSISVCLVGALGDQYEGEQSQEAFLNSVRTNFEGPAFLFNLLAVRYQKIGSGIMVGVSSIAGSRGRRSNYIYGSSKAGFTSYLSGLRARMHQFGVSVITVIPGYVNTKMTKSINTIPILTSSPSFAAKIIKKSIDDKKDIVYVSRIWVLIAFMLKIIPEKIFKRLNF